MCVSQAELERFPQLCLMRRTGGEIDHQGRNNLRISAKALCFFFLLIRMIIAPDSFVLPNCSLMHKPLFLLKSSKTPWKDGEREKAVAVLTRSCLPLPKLTACLGTDFHRALPASPPVSSSCPSASAVPSDFCLFFTFHSWQAGVNVNWAADKKCANYASEKGPVRALISGSIS